MATRLIRGKRAKEQWIQLLIYMSLLFFGVLTFYPFFATILLSFKDATQFETQRWTLSFPLHWVNYIRAWGRIDRYILNSVIVSSVSCMGAIILGTLSAYVIARYDFPGRMLFFYAIISLLMIPLIFVFIPKFMVVLRLGMLNTFWGLWLIYIGSGQVFVIFVLRTFFASIPNELLESAKLDGAGEIHILWHIVVPLSKPIIATLAVLNILGTWNDIVWPIIVISKDNMKTLAIGLLSLREVFYNIAWGPLFAGYVIASIPLIILFGFTSRLFISGLTSGALKM